MVYADLGKIQQVLYNLIGTTRSNSVRGFDHLHPDLHRYEKSSFPSRYRHRHPEDSQKKIFERFYKTDLSRGKDKKGTGLGLAIVKEIVQAHGENIDVVSTEGVGTEFIFSLPKATAL